MTGTRLDALIGSLLVLLPLAHHSNLAFNNLFSQLSRSLDQPCTTHLRPSTGTTRLLRSLPPANLNPETLKAAMNHLSAVISSLQDSRHQYMVSTVLRNLVGCTCSTACWRRRAHKQRAARRSPQMAFPARQRATADPALALIDRFPLLDFTMAVTTLVVPCRSIRVFASWSG